VDMTAAQPGAAEPMSMYDRIGGGPTIRDVVERLYDWILADVYLQPYFDGVDISRVKRHMAAVLTEVLGGPGPYLGPDLGEAHRRLGVTAEHYARVVDLAVAALLVAHVPRDVVAVVEVALEKTQTQIAVGPEWSPPPAPDEAAGESGAEARPGDR
jgi:hemoglobin